MNPLEAAKKAGNDLIFGDWLMVMIHRPEQWATAKAAFIEDGQQAFVDELYAWIDEHTKDLHGHDRLESK